MSKKLSSKPNDVENPYLDSNNFESEANTCCIYRIYENFWKVNPEAYTPQIVSIGPFHHGKPSCSAMQKQKDKYLQYFMDRVRDQRALDCYKAFLQDKEEDIRKAYSQEEHEPAGFDNIAGFSEEKNNIASDFVNMIFLDSVFIMELCLTYQNHDQYKNYSITPVRLLSIKRDMLLLENQLPLFVLQELHCRVVVPTDIYHEHQSFFDIVLKYFTNFLDEGSSTRKLKVEEMLHLKHFTDFIRYCYIPVGGWYKGECQYSGVLKSAKKLSKAWVFFEAVAEGKCLLDIKFKKEFLFFRRFQIPRLKIAHTTESVFGNIIALEQHHYPERDFVSNYIARLDDLIDDNEDAALLFEKQIIVNTLGSNEEETMLIKSLSKQLVLTSKCFCQLTKEVNEYHDNFITRLKSVYLGDI